MHPLVVAGLAAALLGSGYRFYVGWLGRKIFELDDRRPCPSVAERDGKDFLPTAKWVVFGHHFTSIAGTGPIVGPAIAVTWGWVPALIWVIFGSIFIGAVHDFGSLVVSLRHRGRTVGEIAGTLLNPRVRRIFLLIFFLALTIVLAVFGVVVASVFRMFPAAIFPCLVQIPLAMAVGVWLRHSGKAHGLSSLLVLGLMYASVIFGDVGWLHAFNETLAAWPVWLWVVVLLVYSYAASVLPVWLLLQPRDFINALQLISILLLLVVGLFWVSIAGTGGAGGGVAFEMVAPAVRWEPPGAPPIAPFLFITIACGAISGFHCLVCSGTSSKQLKRESDAPMVGAGSMLLEGLLAVLVILACCAGLGLGLKGADGLVLTGQTAWMAQYQDWGTSGGLAATIGAFVAGSANFLGALGISTEMAVALMGVFVASFAATTMDSACRLQRYVIQEMASDLGNSLPGVLGRGVKLAWNPHPAALIAVAAAALLAAVPPAGLSWSFENAGKGGLLLWPLFGATNQLLAGLAFAVLFFYLRKEGRPFWFMVVPGIFMLLMPFWAMSLQMWVGYAGHPSWLADGNWVLLGLGLLFLGLELWMILEACFLLGLGKRASNLSRVR